MPRALLLFGHADTHTFNDRLAEAYTRGYAASGGEIDRLDLAALAFDPVLRSGHRAEQPLEPDLVHARDAIERADHLVWVFPTYWAAQPAVVRGFVDRLFLPGWAFRYEGGALPTGLLRGRSARVISTMDSPWWWYTLVLQRPTHRAFGAATLSFCGIAPVRYTTVHEVRTLDEAERSAWCTRVEHVAANDAKRAPRRLSARAASAAHAPARLG
jgi:NAD(P)H dehydrogenase (quinone)